MTEPVVISLIAGIFGVLAGVPAALSAWLSYRTRQENTDQHGQSQQKLDLVARHVEITGMKVDYLGDRVDDLSVQHKQIASTLHTHLGQESKDA